MRPLLLGIVAAALLAAQSNEDDACRRALAIPEPAGRLTAIFQFLARYPNSPSIPLLVTRAFDGATRARAPELAADLSRRLAKSLPSTRADAARALSLLRTLPPHDAEAYARLSIDALNPDDFIARERRAAERKSLPFYVDEALEKFRHAEAASWSALGRALIRQGRDAEARQALQKSLAAARTADAAAAFAELAAKQGDIHTVIDALGTAILTGKADPGTIEKFHAAYRESGMRPDPDRWLDRRYRTESRNPLQPPPFRGHAPTPRRAVVLEFVTGPACEPCLSVDLAADALLHRYSREDLVVIARHAQPDAPSVTLDGQPFDAGQGLASLARPVFDALDAAIQKRLTVPAEAAIQLRSAWMDGALTVDAAIEPAARPASLQVFLVDTELSFSGTNGLRLHPMVVRASSPDAHSTFAIAGPAARLALIAVVQDAATHRVLQSAYFPVEPPQ